MTERKLVSADSHVNEPPDLWQERIDKAFQDRAPRVVDDISGRPPGSYLVLEGIPPVHLNQGRAAGKKPEEPAAFFQNSTYKDARRGGWDPAQGIEDMEIDGVEAEVIYTTLGFRQFWLKDAALQRACFRACNDWLAEYCAYAPKRLAGLTLISLYDIEEATKELRRSIRIGLKGAMVWASPTEDRPYSDSMYDPFWAEAQDLGMPLSLHSITGMGPESQAARVMGREIQSLDRYLRSVAFENFRYMHPTSLKLSPSEYFHRQIYATFIDDPLAVTYRHQVGIDNVMWSSDYPHTASTWPHSQELIERDFKDVPGEEKGKIVRENVIRLYSLDLA